MKRKSIKDTFTESQQAALRQYFIDHSHIQPNGYTSVLFYMRDMDDFYYRLSARDEGYKRIDAELYEQFALKKKKKWNKHWERYKYCERVMANPIVRFVAHFIPKYVATKP